MIESNDKATAPIPPAVTGGGQSQSQNADNNISKDKQDYNSENDFLELQRLYRQTCSPDYLHTVSLTELYDTNYLPKTQVIDGLLCSGVYLFAGAPKVGKSFLMAQIGYHISAGIKLWEYPVSKGAVLFLALEDDYSRLQKRLSGMFGLEGNENFHFATHAKHIGGGLDGQLNKFVQEHTETKLIIVDTLQKVREVGSDKFSYGSDYDIITQFKQFADKHNICVMIVHHTRKRSAEDCFETISGTNGLLGAADGAFILQKDKRTDDMAVLDIVGRDLKDQRLHLLFDQERCVWHLTEMEKDLRKEPADPVLVCVAELLSLESPVWSGSASELVSSLGGLEIQPNVMTRRLNVGADRLLNKHGIRYECSRNRAGSFIKLTLNEAKA